MFARLLLRIVAGLAFGILLSTESSAAPPAAVPASTRVSGAISGTTAWSLAGSPYIISGHAWIPDRSSLSIDPGVEVRFAEGGYFTVMGGGTLTAVGAATQPITFTSTTPSTAGKWYYIAYESGSAGRLSHCVMEYGGQGTYAALYVRSSAVVVEQCRLHSNQANAISLEGAGITPTLRDLTVEDNGGIAIQQTTISMAPVYERLTLRRNGTNAVVLPPGTIDRDLTLDGVKAGTPFVVGGGQVLIAASRTLTLTAGTVWRVGVGFYLTVSSGGALVADGSAERPVTFTAHTDAPTTGKWYYIAYESGSAGRLSHCVMEYGGQGTYAALYVRSSAVVVEQCLLRRNQANAINLEGTGITPTLRDLTVEDNGGIAIQQSTIDMAPVYERLTLRRNSTNAVVLPPGTIDRDLTLDGVKAGTPFVVGGGHVLIAASRTLTLTAGTVWRVGVGFYLTVSSGGALVADGSAERPVTFTAHMDEPTTGQWYYIAYENGSAGRLRHCVMEYGGRSNYAALYVRSSAVVVEQCRLHSNQANAISLEGAGITPTLRDLTVEDNGGIAIQQTTIDMAPVYERLTLRRNSTNAVVLPPGTIDRDLTLDGVKAGTPFVVGGGQVLIAASRTLTLTAGTVWRVGVGFYLTVSSGGALVADGSAERPVTFTAHTDAPTTGKWYYIAYESGSAGRLSHCVMEYGGQGTYAALYVRSSAVVVEQCRLHSNQANAISLEGAGITPTLRDLTVEDNGGIAIQQTTIDMAPVYQNLTLRDNAGGNIVYVSSGSLRGGNVTLDSRGLNGAPLVTESINVHEGAVLALAPGTTLSMQPGASINVAAASALIARGTAQHPVVMTVYGSVPAPGQWGGITVDQTSRLRLEYCEITAAGRNGAAVIYAYSTADIRVTNCRLHDNAATTFTFDNEFSGKLMAQNNQFYDNAFGVRYPAGSRGAQPVDFRNNFWGSSRGPFHPILNRFGKGIEVSDGVRFEPWLLGKEGNSLNLHVLDDVAPKTAGNVGQVTLELAGVGFQYTTVVTLITPGGQALAAIAQELLNPYALRATFDLTGQPPGIYRPRATWADASQSTLEPGLEVVVGTGGRAWGSLQVPAVIRTGTRFLFTLEYGNNGDTNVSAPWMTVHTSPGLVWQQVDGPLITTRSIDVLGISFDGDSGVLRPGQRETLVFSATLPAGSPQPVINYWAAKPEQRRDAGAMITLAGHDPAETPWPDVASRLRALFGTTHADYQEALATLASEMGRMGSASESVDQLLVFAVNREAAALRKTGLAHGLPSVLQDTATTPASNDICVERHDQYATDPTTYGVGSRTTDGGWVPWQVDRELLPMDILMTEYYVEADIVRNTGGIYFWDDVLPEWVDHYLGGTGQPWTATYEHPVAAKAAQMLDQLPQIKQLMEAKLQAVVEQHVIDHEPPEGISTAEVATTVVGGLDFAKYTVPELGNALWNLGETTVALGRSPSGNDAGIDVELFRGPGTFYAKWEATDVPSRIEDIFQIWEEKVNAACKTKVPYQKCAGYKGDIKLLFMWAYMLDRFGPANCFNWNINFVVPRLSGQVLLAGVEANAGGDITVMLGEDEEETTVTLNGSARVASATLMGAGDPKSAFVWTGFPNPPDVQTSAVRLRAGTYVFVLEANAKGRLRYEGRTFSDLDTITVTVLPHDPDDEKKPRPVNSWDPNDKVAPAGVDGSNVLTPNSVLAYRINFENDPKLASAPAQTVRISDTLDSKLDWSSLEFESFGFGTQLVMVEPGSKDFQSEVDLTGSGIDLYVKVEGRFDPASGTLVLDFTSLDPTTRQPTTDPLAGFLPPNDASGRGEGFITFKVKPRADLALGTAVPNSASIFFDTNAAIVTNVATVVIDNPRPPAIFLPLITMSRR